MKHLTVIAPSSIVKEHAKPELGAAAAWARQTLRWSVTFGDGWDDSHSWGGAGLPHQRAERLTRALATSDAVFCAAGGDHAAELLPYLHTSPERERGWFVGTSDNTLLALTLAARGHVTFCGPDLRLRSGEHSPTLGMSNPLDFSYTQRAVGSLFHHGGERVVIPLPNGPSGQRTALRPGDANGQLVACNLPALLKLAGTPHWPGGLLNGAILLVEQAGGNADLTVAELVALSQLGVLHRISALVFGWLDGFDLSPHTSGIERVFAAALDLTPPNKPVYHAGWFGHRCPHAMLPIGAATVLSGGQLIVTWPAQPTAP